MASGATVKGRRYYFRTRDLVLISAVSSAGGVLSTYVGYLGNLLNKAFGVPFGAGQWMAGLHVFWFVLVRVAVGRTGAGTLAGVLKGTVEMFTGSTHGLPIVLISTIEGLLVDLALLPFTRPPLAALCIAGGIAAASNVVVFQALYFSGVSWGYLALMILFAFGSGIVFGGYFADGVLGIVEGARILRLKPGAPPSWAAHLGVSGRPGRAEHTGHVGRARRSSKIHLAVTLLMGVALAGGAVYYYTEVFEPFWKGPTCTVEGKVANPYVYRPVDFGDEVVTVTAELKGQVTYRPPADYTGVPLARILERAHPDASATRVRVLASDGYEAEFDLGDIMEDRTLILIREGENLRLIAAGYEGGYWVRMVTRVVVQ
ncbi:MAG: ECF transporter S component [Bacillota bacterium]|nr:ECF transporter S component [Bacillota bacterium]